MWWRRWWSDQGGKSWFLGETSTWTWRERADGDLMWILKWRWRHWGLRSSPHTSSCNGEHEIDIRDHGRWWNRGSWWGPGHTIFWVPIIRSFRTWLSRTHNTTPATTWSWCVYVLPPQGISHITLGARYVSLFVRPDVRRGHRQTIFLRSLGALSRSKTNWRGITTHGFPSWRGDSCMIVYMSPLQYKSTFLLYSPLILSEEKDCQFINFFIM